MRQNQQTGYEPDIPDITEWREKVIEKKQPRKILKQFVALLKPSRAFLGGLILWAGINLALWLIACGMAYGHITTPPQRWNNERDAEYDARYQEWQASPKVFSLDPRDHEIILLVFIGGNLITLGLIVVNRD